MGSAEVYLSVLTKRNSKELLSKNPVKIGELTILKSTLSDRMRRYSYTILSH